VHELSDKNGGFRYKSVCDVDFLLVYIFSVRLTALVLILEACQNIEKLKNVYFVKHLF
jgi:hypothetical protein